MNDLIQCHIKKIVNNGYGLATHQGKTLLVEKVLPNETVLCQPLAIHRSYIKAEPIKILSPSPFRTSPVCNKNSECGGCDFSYTYYPNQIHVKNAVLKDTIKRLAGIDISSIKTVPSNKAIGYRSRIRLKIKAHKGTGYFSRGSNNFVPVGRCPLANFQIRRVQRNISKIISGYSRADQLEEIELISPPRSDRPFAILKSHDLKHGKELATEFLKEALLSGVMICNYDSRIILGNKYIDWPYEINTSYGTKQFIIKTEPGCFSQINWSQNLKVINDIVEVTNKLGCKKILDLYSGFGNIAISLATLGKTVLAIEQNRQAVLSLKNNIKLLGLDNIKAKCTYSGKALREIRKMGQTFNMCIVDPPRAGIRKETLTRLVNMKFQHLLYLSCNPATLARDLKILFKAGYNVSHITIYDFFPQTWHIETLTRLDLST